MSDRQQQPISAERLAEMREAVRTYGSANCWTCTTRFESATRCWGGVIITKGRCEMTRYKRYLWCQNFDEYWEGLEAAVKGGGPEKNPYEKQTKPWICWRAGWLGVC